MAKQCLLYNETKCFKVVDQMKEECCVGETTFRRPIEMFLNYECCRYEQINYSFEDLIPRFSPIEKTSSS